MAEPLYTALTHVWTKMARATIVFGLMLCATTLFALLSIRLGRITTAFVPIVFGVPIFICGVISLNPHRAKFWIRTAALFALLGGFGCVVRVGTIGLRWSQGEQPYTLPLAIASGLGISLIVFAAVAIFATRNRLPRRMD